MGQWDPMSETPEQTESGWVTEAVRLTLFPVPGERVATNSWEEIAGGIATQVNREPALGMQQEIGPFHNGRLAMVSQPDRCILLFTPEFLVSSPTSELAHLGPPAIAVERFLVAAHKLLRKDALIKRLGFGLVVLRRIASTADGLRSLFEGLHIDRDASDASEFLFQVNVPLRSELLEGDYRLNRIAKWQVLSLQVTNLSVTPEGGQMGSTFVTPIIRLELDINTPPSYPGAFSTAQVKDTIGECTSAARNILDRGGLSI
jgi:hypothetical protein